MQGNSPDYTIYSDFSQFSCFTISVSWKNWGSPVDTSVGRHRFEQVSEPAERPPAL